MDTKAYKQTLNVLIKSAINGNEKIFQPTLKNNYVSVTMYNKSQFYRFYKQMILCNKVKQTSGNYYKWGRLKVGNKNYLILKILNDTKKFPLLSFMIDKTNSQIILKILPF